MKGKCVFTIIVLIFLQSAILWGDSYWSLSLDTGQQDDPSDERQKKSDMIDNYEKDMLLGYFMAAVPGFFVHGAGNFYAGNVRRGAVLCLAGVVSSCGIILYNMGQALDESSEPPTTGAKIWYGISLTLFFGSWLWDIMTVQDSIEDRHPSGANISFGPIQSLYSNDNVLALGVNLGIRF